MITKQKGVAALSLLVIALPAGAAPVTVRAHSDDVRIVRVSYADLNIASDAGIHHLMQRVTGAAKFVCDVSYGPGLIEQQTASWNCFKSSMTRARADISLIQQRAQNGLSARGEIEVAQR